jgi:hypothetical protein
LVVLRVKFPHFYGGFLFLKNPQMVTFAKKFS